MADAKPWYACRLCRHVQMDHNKLGQCAHCKCGATPAEAQPTPDTATTEGNTP